MKKRIRKFPHIDDYLNAEGISNYLNISPKNWKAREYNGSAPPPLIIDKVAFYKWEDILLWMRNQSTVKPLQKKSHKILAERNASIIARYYELLKEVKKLSKKRTLLTAAKLLAEEFNMKYMTVYNVLYQHKNKNKIKAKELNDKYFQSKVNENNKVINIEFPKIPKIVNFPLMKKETEQNTKKQLGSEILPSKNGLFNKIYNMIVISDHHKKPSQSINTNGKEQ